MLLRRMMEHVEEQNWFAVVLDFFIVVSGVFLAFQLATWAEEREAQERAEIAVIRLHEESVAVVRFLDAQTANFDFLTGMQDRAVAALTSGNIESLDERTAQVGIFSMRFFPATAPPRTVYDEMSATGMLTRIEDQTARQAIATYYQTLEFYQGQLDYFRQAVTSADLAESEGVVFYYDPEADERMGVRIDLPTIAADEAYVDDLLGQLRNQIVIQTERRRVRDAAVAMCEALAAAIDDTCERDDLSGEFPSAPPEESQSEDTP